MLHLSKISTTIQPSMPIALLTINQRKSLSKLSKPNGNLHRNDQILHFFLSYSSYAAFFRLLTLHVLTAGVSC